MHHNAGQRVRRCQPLLICVGLFACAQEPATNHDTRAPGSDVLLKAPKLTVAANHPETLSPLDATPSPDGSRIYYLALRRDSSDQLSAGVFGVDAVTADAGEIEPLALGAPLVSPLSIASSLDGESLYIADAAAGADASGALFRLATSGGTPERVFGTQGYRPGGLVVGEQERQQLLYFTGREPDSGVAGVFRVASEGGVPDMLARFDAGSEPGGVALTHSGDLYVADNTATGARVLRIHGDSVATWIDGIGLGFPAGIALSYDEQTLLVSGLDPDTRHDVVYRVDVASGELSQLTDAVAPFREAAGLHRAHDTDVFAWADSQANGSGTVYTVQF